MDHSPRVWVTIDKDYMVESPIEKKKRNSNSNSNLRKSEK